MPVVQAGEPPVYRGAASEGGRPPPSAPPAILTALAQPKEREKLIRLEQELTRLVSNPAVDRLDMQPMSAHNRALVAGVAAYFGLRFVVVPADETAPAAAPHEGERLLPVWLGKCEETQMPAERLASLVPIPEEAAPVLRQEKVQLMRRAGGGANGKSTKAPEQLTAAEEQARHKDREDAYAAARQRIFGSAAQGGDGAAGGDASAPSAADGGASPAPAERAAAGAPSAAGAKHGAPSTARSVHKSESQRAQDMMDPDFSRHAVRWASSAAPHAPLQCAGGGYDEAAAQLHRRYLGAGAAQSAPRYSQCSGWGLQMPQQMPQHMPQQMHPQMHPQLTAASLGVGMSSLSLGGGAVPIGGGAIPMGAMAGQMPLYARPTGQVPLGAGAVQGRETYGAYGGYGAPTLGMPSNI